MATVKKALLHIIALLLGILAFVFSFGAATIALGFLGSLPFVGHILYWPSDAAWTLCVIPPSIAAYAAAALSDKICSSTKPISAVISIFWIINLIAIFALHNFTWKEFFQSIVGLVSACILLSD